MKIVRMFEADNLDKCPRFTGDEGVQAIKPVDAALSESGMIALLRRLPGESGHVIVIGRIAESLLDEAPPEWFFGGWKEIEG